MDMICPFQAILHGSDMSVTCHSTWKLYVRYMPFYVEVICPLQAFLRGGGITAAERPGGRGGHVRLDEDHP